MSRRTTLLLTAALLLSIAGAHTALAEDIEAPSPKRATTKGAFSGQKLMYTTYFYTASEAIVHGYEKGTKVRIISLLQRRTVWEGTVGPGETKNIATGKGVFGFLSDKKASILVGTPSACTAVGYWLRDETGSFLSKRFYTELPSSISAADARVLVWARADTSFTVTNLTTDKLIHKGKLKTGGYYEMPSSVLGQMNSHVLEFASTNKALQVQVYYDEGFFVPGPDGRLAGKHFQTYVGNITQGSNDLNLFSYNRDAKATVKDIKSGEAIWSGVVKAGTRHSINLSQRYVTVTSNAEISVSVSPKDFQGYNEHHFAGGVEGMGIETDFMLNASGELWIFSYYNDNHVSIVDAAGKPVWSGTLQAGHVQGLNPQAGMFRIKSTKGTSAMGGWGACGAEYSPAGGMFQIDEELFKVATIILKERREKAKKEGRKLTAQEAAAPLSAAENAKARKYMKDTLNKSMSEDEVNERMDAMTVE